MANAVSSEIHHHSSQGHCIMQCYRQKGGRFGVQSITAVQLKESIGACVMINELSLSVRHQTGYVGTAVSFSISVNHSSPSNKSWQPMSWTSLRSVSITDCGWKMDVSLCVWVRQLTELLPQQPSPWQLQLCSSNQFLSISDVWHGTNACYTQVLTSARNEERKEWQLAEKW